MPAIVLWSSSTASSSSSAANTLVQNRRAGVEFVLSDKLEARAPGLTQSPEPAPDRARPTII